MYKADEIRELYRAERDRPRPAPSNRRPSLEELDRKGVWYYFRDQNSELMHEKKAESNTTRPSGNASRHTNKGGS